MLVFLLLTKQRDGMLDTVSKRFLWVAFEVEILAVCRFYFILIKVILFYMHCPDPLNAK